MFMSRCLPTLPFQDVEKDALQAQVGGWELVGLLRFCEVFVAKENNAFWGLTSFNLVFKIRSKKTKIQKKLKPH